MSNGWKYYNGALIPTSAPHEKVNIEKIKSGEIWKEFSKQKPYFARWTSDFDCGKETEWWYVIKDSPFDIEKLSSSAKKHIRQALKKNRVIKIIPEEYKAELYRCYEEACLKYNSKNTKITYDDFVKTCKRSTNLTYFGCFSIDDNILIGYMIVEQLDSYARIVSAKYSTKYLKNRASDALHYTILDKFLNNSQNKYISSGEKNINHITNAQEYKIQNFNFRKAYCKLNITYNPKYKWLIKFLYPFRKLLKLFGGIGFIHKINSVLMMEGIVRRQKND